VRTTAWISFAMAYSDCPEFPVNATTEEKMRIQRQWVVTGGGQERQQSPHLWPEHRIQMNLRPAHDELVCQYPCPVH
jgi:hypothetical protein